MFSTYTSDLNPGNYSTPRQRAQTPQSHLPLSRSLTTRWEEGNVESARRHGWREYVERGSWWWCPEAFFSLLIHHWERVLCSHKLVNKPPAAALSLTSSSVVLRDEDLSPATRQPISLIIRYQDLITHQRTVIIMQWWRRLHLRRPLLSFTRVRDRIS